MKLDDKQIQTIRHEIDNSMINLQTLKDDVLDHLCCVVEGKMEQGKSFDLALKEALPELAPKGLNDIQRQTVQLMNPPKIIFMKKVMYLIGLLSAAALSLGWLFTVLRWPGGVELFNSGFFAFLMLFLPIVAIERYKVTLKRAWPEKLRILLGFVSSFTVGLSLLFKVLHLQGADIVLISGVIVFTFGFLPFLFFNLYRKAISDRVVHAN